MRLGSLAVLAALYTTQVSGSSSSSNSSPVIALSYGSFQGQVVDTVAEFLGIPFAAPPTGERRFGLPEAPIPFSGIHNATVFGAPCPQQAMPIIPDLPFPPPSGSKDMSEDCLFVNVFRPADMRRKKLPVIFYIFGGGFENGDASPYPGNPLVNRSLALGEPVIYVSANYRINAFGFLGGKEVKEKGLTNVGLHDQRFALEWIQNNIAAFGGDPDKVTIWGGSAGASSVGLHLTFNEGNTRGLFSAAIMESGAPMRLPDVLEQQVYFDNLVIATNCTDAPDRFQCLRSTPYPALQSAVDASPGLFSYQNFRLAWSPMVDGTLIPRHPMQLVEAGKYAKVPFISGDSEDEGTVFSLTVLNITTDAQFVEYVKTNYFSYVTDEDMQQLADAYPEDVTQGSPFNTGTANARTPQFKRIAAMQGDVFFQGPRRFFLGVASKTQSAYSYRYARNSSAPALGVFHGSEVSYFFGLGSQTDLIATDALIYFAGKHDPNPPADSISLLRGTKWPKWTESSLGESPLLLSFVDPSPSLNITPDTYRSEAINLVIKLDKL